GAAVPESPEQEHGQRPGQAAAGAEVVEKAGIVARAREGRGDDRESEQQEMSPDPILKFRAGPPDRRSRLQIYPMFCRSLPGLKRMVRPGGIRTSLPVRGVRPTPRLRGFPRKTPKAPRQMP